MKSGKHCLLIIGLPLILIACSEKHTYEPIILPETAILSETSNWGVVTSNFLRIRERPTRQAAVITGITKGMVLKIISTEGKKETLEGQTAYWFRVEYNGDLGWVFGAYINLFKSKAEAEENALKQQ
ncbi:MAG: SH3 domain-containing protein [Spirochaetales bacterium]|nr:SH3 domain-containing protein [Spirochaetales bacterium]